MSSAWVIALSMLRERLRDRAAFALTFVVPVVMFLIFAAIFGGSSSDAGRLDVALADEAKTTASHALLQALAREDAVRTVQSDGDPGNDTAPTLLTAEAVRELVRSGKADAGVIVTPAATDGLLTFGPRAKDRPSAVTLVIDPSRAVAGQMVSGLLQKNLLTSLPSSTMREGMRSFDSLVAPLTPEQKAALERVSRELDRDASNTQSQATQASPFATAIATEEVNSKPLGRGLVAYYAGGTAVMFLLLSMFHSAVRLQEERTSGLLDRFLATPHGLGPVLMGRFLAATITGVLQLSTVFIVAWLVHDVPLWQHIGAFLVVTVLTAAMAGSLGMAVVAWCRSLAQAEAVATAIPLVLAAFGGSMVPRLFMPPMFRRFGDYVPNGWALDAYHGIFWREESLAQQSLALSVLAATSLLALWLARRGVKRWETI